MDRLLDLLNIADSGFPTGGFGHSNGLEYGIQQGWVYDGETLAAWARGYFDRSFSTLDLRSAVKAWALEQKAGGSLVDWEDQNRELASFRPSRLQREASAQVGRSFLRSVGDFYPELDPGAGGLLGFSGRDTVQFPLAWGSVCGALGLGVNEGVKALWFSALRQMTMVAIRVIPLGQKEAFRVQTALLQEWEDHRDWGLEGLLDLESFTPGADLAGLGMENLACKYFRS